MGVVGWREREGEERERKREGGCRGWGGQRVEGRRGVRAKFSHFLITLHRLEESLWAGNQVSNITALTQRYTHTHMDSYTLHPAKRERLFLPLCQIVAPIFCERGVMFLWQSGLGAQTGARVSFGLKLSSGEIIDEACLWLRNCTNGL